jgi:hypothetical protein
VTLYLWLWGLLKGLSLLASQQWWREGICINPNIHLMLTVSITSSFLFFYFILLLISCILFLLFLLNWNLYILSSAFDFWLDEDSVAMFEPLGRYCHFCIMSWKTVYTYLYQKRNLFWVWCSPETWWEVTGHLKALHLFFWLWEGDQKIRFIFYFAPWC